MSINQTNKPGNEKSSGGNFGNASNPSPHNRKTEQAMKKQILDEKAEKYIRESGNIEDMPDPQEQWDAEKIIEKEK